jgi:16S rRNA C967 or C1407 C5-methylase (RsmB/RsmF family)
MSTPPSPPTSQDQQAIQAEKISVAEKKSGLSIDLQEFYASHNIEVSSIDKNNPFRHRFIRLNPRYNQEETLHLLTQEISKIACGSTPGKPMKVPWLDQQWAFYCLPGDFPIAKSSCFRSGRVYGMDVSSGAAVAALLSNIYDMKSSPKDSNSTENLRILDLCCCPGLKLCAMADVMKDTSSTLVGVDVSENRMALCKKIIQKYHIDQETSGGNQSDVHIRLYCQDGTTFGKNEKGSNNLIFDSQIAAEESQQRGKRKRMNKSARGRERKRLREIVSADLAIPEPPLTPPPPNSTNGTGSPTDDVVTLQTPQIQLFDRVLVDAECSTDGSLKHMEKRFLKDSSAARNLLLTDQAQLSVLVDLQKRLISSGFQLLKPGGTMVYSTCSLSEDQNEGVVQWFLDQFKDSFLIPVHFPLAKSLMVAEGRLKGTVRFHPNLGTNPEDMFGGGFFLSKFGKL